jgi:hypothetical protein
MASQISSEVLDNILALQLLVAWAGEAECEPSRLGWWRTDLIDEAGGGYLLAQLLPKTHRWASLEAVRQCAIRIDRQQRAEMAQPDAVRTLFFWGFATDELLSDRMKEHKKADKPPEEALPLSISLNEELARPDLISALSRSEEVPFTVAPNGRLIKGPMPEEYDVRAKTLAAALLPLSDSYPMPFYRLETL